MEIKKEVKEIVIRIKVEEGLISQDIEKLFNVLYETEKPEWRKNLPRWQTGSRERSSRCLALMLHALEQLESNKALEIKKAPEVKKVPEVNYFG